MIPFYHRTADDPIQMNCTMNNYIWTICNHNRAWKWVSAFFFFFICVFSMMMLLLPVVNFRSTPLRVPMIVHKVPARMLSHNINIIFLNRALYTCSYFIYMRWSTATRINHRWWSSLPFQFDFFFFRFIFFYLLLKKSIYLGMEKYVVPNYWKYLLYRSKRQTADRRIYVTLAEAKWKERKKLNII